MTGVLQEMSMQNTLAHSSSTISAVAKVLRAPDNSKNMNSAGVEQFGPQKSEYQKMLATAMEHIESQGELELLLLKDDTLRQWWVAYNNHKMVEKHRAAAIAKMNETFSDEELKHIQEHLAMTAYGRLK